METLTLLSALAVHTTHIGLTATASTSYNEPFTVARQFASLDHLSAGRSGWNVVTSATDAEARNFNLDHQLPHAARYRRAREFMKVVTGLWDSWEDDAFVYDKEGGRFFDPSKLHILGHRGDHFQVRGPLNVARPPQGHPVIVEAGSSPDGQDLAARWAEVVFTVQQTLEGAQAYYRGLKKQVADHGRHPEQVKVLPGAFIVSAAPRPRPRTSTPRCRTWSTPSSGSACSRTSSAWSTYPVTRWTARCRSSRRRRARRASSSSSPSCSPRAAHRTRSAVPAPDAPPQTVTPATPRAGCTNSLTWLRG
ncbi:NtaA/DmoA family FMN-dependent monooxygenase [Streptomyces sp. NPDC005483]|uniref:NtaA/DmoA family FMN-dependent monooxygenase n=1 Tax=Streptomyces sp. NPDC005483 TaxID=3154882 RepID=UPI0033A69808